MNNSIYGLYIPDDPIDKKEKVLFLLREPGTPYDPYNSNSNHQWWNDVKCGVQGKRYSNGPAEGLNNAIKTIIKDANGYKNFDRFRKRILLVLNKRKDLPL